MKKIINILLIICMLLTITSCNSHNQENSKEVTNTLKATIDDKEYIINLEVNNTTNKLVELLPLELNMNELNGNEKYVYLENKLPTNSFKPIHINSGDVMLYGDNCLVIFYKSFDTQYSYTKIGHIDNLPELGNNNISIKITNNR